MAKKQDRQYPTRVVHVACNGGKGILNQSGQAEALVKSSPTFDSFGDAKAFMAKRGY